MRLDLIHRTRLRHPAQFGRFPKFRVFGGDSYNRDYSIVGSILGSPAFGESIICFTNHFVTKKVPYLVLLSYKKYVIYGADSLSLTYSCAEASPLEAAKTLVGGKILLGLGHADNTTSTPRIPPGELLKAPPLSPQNTGILTVRFLRSPRDTQKIPQGPGWTKSRL